MCEIAKMKAFLGTLGACQQASACIDAAHQPKREVQLVSAQRSVPNGSFSLHPSPNGRHPDARSLLHMVADGGLTQASPNMCSKLSTTPLHRWTAPITIVSSAVFGVVFRRP